MKKLIQGVVFGVMFGFLLQKGGVTKYHILEGQLLLVDFTVMKVMLSAILVGMIGFYFLKEKGFAKPHIKPANLGANIIGGLIFGLGFALAGYCPGTGAAALGQGNLNALYYMGGMFVGSYVYAEFSKPLKQNVKNWMNKGEITLPELFHISERNFIALFGTILLLVLIVLNLF
ncbi:MAG: YeeE/YedE family protein [Peredibacter sp.]|nr:YeeE/YedE family protein [Peredibacter sp.]|tara:strand:- start:232 stop:753 length:522 start_codon:yes stop_codon:yes gene_type:complete